MRRFSAWLVEERELRDDPLIGSKAPKLDAKVVPVLTEDHLRALIAACTGPDLRDRRDEAIVRLMTETGMRAGEVVDLRMPDVDLPGGLAIVRRGKGGKGRTVPFGPQTSRSLDRYLRLRRSHRLGETLPLWLGDRGKGFTYYGLHAALRFRAEKAGLVGFHPHVLRHTAASRWLAAGGSEGGLMAVAGWSRRDMIDRYTKATAETRAADEARTLQLDHQRPCVDHAATTPRAPVGHVAIHRQRHGRLMTRASSPSRRSMAARIAAHTRGRPPPTAPPPQRRRVPRSTRSSYVRSIPTGCCRRMSGLDHVSMPGRHTSRGSHSCRRVPGVVVSIDDVLPTPRSAERPERLRETKAARRWSPTSANETPGSRSRTCEEPHHAPGTETQPVGVQIPLGHSFVVPAPVDVLVLKFPPPPPRQAIGRAVGVCGACRDRAIAPIRPGSHRAPLPMSPPPGPRRPLPLATVSTPPTCTVRYGMSALDSGGRINDRVIADVLGWTPGTAVTDSPTKERVVVVRPDAGGHLRYTPSGNLRLPATIRHRCQLQAGERLCSSPTLTKASCGSIHLPHSTS